MRLTLLVAAAITSLCFLVGEESEPPIDTAWLDLGVLVRGSERPAPQLTAGHDARLSGAALLDREPGPLFEDLLAAFLSQRKPKAKWLLDRLRAAGARMYPTLIDQLPRLEDLPSSRLRRSIARLILLEAGPRAVPYLLDAVDTGSTTLAAAAAIRLYQISGDSDGCLPALIRYLDEPRDWRNDDAGAVLRTIHAIGHGARKAAPVLSQFLGVSVRIRRHARWRRDYGAGAYVSVGTYVHEILRSMGAGAEQAVGDLEQALLRGASRANRIAVLYEVGRNARTLAHLGPRGRATLIRLLDHDDTMVRQLVAGSLLQVEDGVADLIDATQDRYALRRLTALGALAGRAGPGDERVVKALIPLLHDRDEHVQGSAAMALALLGESHPSLRATVLHGLAGCLRRGDTETRYAALRALRELRRTAPHVGESVAAVLPELEGVAFRHALVVIGLSGSKSPDTVAALLATEPRCNAAERSLLAHALARVRPDPSDR